MSKGGTDKTGEGFSQIISNLVTSNTSVTGNPKEVNSVVRLIEVENKKFDTKNKRGDVRVERVGN